LLLHSLHTQETLARFYQCVYRFIVNYHGNKGNSQLRNYHLVIAPNSFGMQVLVCIIVSTFAGKYLPLEHTAKRLILGRGLCNFTLFVHCFKCSIFLQRL